MIEGNVMTYDTLLSLVEGGKGKEGRRVAKVVRYGDCD